MLIERIFPSGGWCISDIIDGILVVRRYFVYSKRDAIAKFKRDTK